MLIFGSIITMIPGQKLFKEGSLFYFLLGYYISTYIRLYNPKFLNFQKTNIIFSLIGMFLMVIWIFLVMKFIPKFVDENSKIFKSILYYPFGSLNRIPLLIIAIFIFSFFKNLNVKSNKIINLIASTTFGVYLIHENLLLNKIIWHRFFKFDEWVNSPLLFLYMIAAVIVTFTCCSILDIIRQKIIEKPVMKLYASTFNRRT